jgi:hypothetical protein
VVEGYQERKRERKALLRILYDDIDRNRRQLEEFDEHPDWITDAPAHELQTQNWLENKITLSRLLDDEEWFDIAKYFDKLVEIDEYRRGKTTAETSEQDRQRAVRKNLPLLRDQQRTAVEHIGKHVSIPHDDLQAFGLAQPPTRSQLDSTSD